MSMFPDGFLDDEKTEFDEKVNVCSGCYIALPKTGKCDNCE